MGSLPILMFAPTPWSTSVIHKSFYWNRSLSVMYINWCQWYLVLISLFISCLASRQPLCQHLLLLLATGNCPAKVICQGPQPSVSGLIGRTYVGTGLSFRLLARTWFMEVWLSCYLVLLSVDSKTRWQDSHISLTRPISTTQVFECFHLDRASFIVVSFCSLCKPLMGISLCTGVVHIRRSLSPFSCEGIHSPVPICPGKINLQKPVSVLVQ